MPAARRGTRLLRVRRGSPSGGRSHELSGDGILLRRFVAEKQTAEQQPAHPHVGELLPRDRYATEQLGLDLTDAAARLPAVGLGLTSRKERLAGVEDVDRPCGVPHR